jgi:hypothetical protein
VPEEPKEGFEERVDAAFAVIDAILNGHQLPEPAPHEAAILGLADYDPDLRYRVAKDVLEQVYGKPRQRVDHSSGNAPLLLVFPDYVPQQVGEGAEVVDGEVLEPRQELDG